MRYYKMGRALWRAEEVWGVELGPGAPGLPWEGRSDHGHGVSVKQSILREDQAPANRLESNISSQIIQH